MQIIDLAFVLSVAALALALVFIPARAMRFRTWAMAAVITLGAFQLILSGIYWQNYSSYVLLVLVALYFLVQPRRFVKVILNVLLVFMVLISAASWSVFLPVPELTKPRGEYSVGTTVFRWVDSTREETTTTDRNDKRNVVVQAWYPATQRSDGTHSPYMDGLGSLPEKVGVIPRFIFDHYDNIDTHGIVNAPVSNKHRAWPVVIFLTGNGVPRSFYTSLVADLASHGYIVLTIDHPYEAAITQLADGRLVTTIDNFREDEPDLLKFMERRLKLRVEDVRYVLDRLHDPFSEDSIQQFFDLNRVVIAGHSLGGATAAVAMALDPRIKAAVNIDGTLYGELPPSSDQRPFLLLESPKDDSIHFQRYENGNRKIFQHFGEGFRYEVFDADHYSFTDAPLLLALPTRLIAGHVLHFGNIPESTHHATVDMLDAFFLGALNNNLQSMDSVSLKHERLVRKEVS